MTAKHANFYPVLLYGSFVFNHYNLWPQWPLKSPGGHLDLMALKYLCGSMKPLKFFEGLNI